MGTPAFAVPQLEALHKSDHDLVAIVTVPDKPAGRGLSIKYSDVKNASLDYNIPIFQPEDLSDSEFINAIQELNPDIIVVVAFRKLPKVLWQIPKFGTFNIHASLLPQYRGAAPINYALINGETKTGLTSFFINEGIDTGTIILSKEMEIDYNDNLESLHNKLSLLGADLAIETLQLIENGNHKAVSQEEIIKTHNISELKKAPKIFKQDCIIDWTLNAEQIRNKIRGLSPIPAAFSYIMNETGKKIQVKIFKAEISDKNLKPGACLITDKEIFVGCGNETCLKILDLQAESRKRMTAEEFIRGLNTKNLWNFVS